MICVQIILLYVRFLAEIGPFSGGTVKLHKHTGTITNDLGSNTSSGSLFREIPIKKAA